MLVLADVYDVIAKFIVYFIIYPALVIGGAIFAMYIVSQGCSTSLLALCLSSIALVLMVVLVL